MFQCPSYHYKGLIKWTIGHGYFIIGIPWHLVCHFRLKKTSLQTYYLHNYSTTFSMCNIMKQFAKVKSWRGEEQSGGFLSPWNNFINICTQQSSWKTQCHYLWKEIHYNNLMNKMNLLIHIVIMCEFAPTVLTNANIRIMTINQHVNCVWIASGLGGSLNVCKVPL